jgi:hypothetical protein
VGIGIKPAHRCKWRNCSQPVVKYLTHLKQAVYIYIFKAVD